MSELSFRPNTLYHGDCMAVMSEWNDDCVDLIYLDPPFNSNAKYNILFSKDTEDNQRDPIAQFAAFNDTWYWNLEAHESVEKIKGALAHPAHKVICGLSEMLPETGMLAYLVYMAERLAEMRRVLKDSGGIYLHCDPTASHYLKTLMDGIFGAKNFRNEIVWCYPPGGGGPKYGFHRKHDILFSYGKSAVGTFHRPYTPVTEAAAKKFTATDEDGRHYKEYPGGRSYLDESKGRPIPDWWTDIHSLGQTISKERLGYPTQKPLALLERIVKASSNAGDIVLDPFCGCGTTARAAYGLKRKFLGIDISPFAITRVCKDRLKEAAGLEVRGLPTDMQSAHAMWSANKFAFERWAVTTLPGFVPNDIQTGDGGIDGRGLMLHPPANEKGLVVAQVKGGGSFTPDQLRAFLSQLHGGKVSMGVFVTLKKAKPTPTLLEVQAKAGDFSEGAKKFNRLQFWSIEEFFHNTRPPLPAMKDPGTGGGMQETIPSE